MRRNLSILLAVFSLAILSSGVWQTVGFPPAPLALAAQTNGASADTLSLPNKTDSVKFAVLGDTGTGGSAQRRIGEAMSRYHARFTFTFALLAGDNMYGSENPRDFKRKFEAPYQTLLDNGVEFYAALGNHDDPNQRHYKLFNMNGERYYTFKPSEALRIFVLDSSYMDPEQVDWISKQLKSSDSPWKIALFHHPLYSSAGRHGSDLELRKTLEPLFVEHGVDVVFAGHDHVYERTKPQQGITHFVVGNSAKLRRGDLKRSSITAAGFDDGYSFLFAEIIEAQLFFEVFSEKGKAIDRGVIRERDASDQVTEK
jgi:predicted phosphodiesterase